MSRWQWINHLLNRTLQSPVICSSGPRGEPPNNRPASMPIVAGKVMKRVVEESATCQSPDMLRARWISPKVLLCQICYGPGNTRSPPKLRIIPGPHSLTSAKHSIKPPATDRQRSSMRWWPVAAMDRRFPDRQNFLGISRSIHFPVTSGHERRGLGHQSGLSMETIFRHYSSHPK